MADSQVDAVEISLSHGESKLNDEDKIKLAQEMKEKRCLWSSDKCTKEEKREALCELNGSFGFIFTSTELMAAWNSHRASMLREVNKNK